MPSSRIGALAALVVAAGVAHAAPGRKRAALDLAPPAPAPAPATVTRPALTVALPPPPPERRRRWGLFATGLTVFAGGYALDVGLTYGLGHQPATTSLIPLAGPLIQCADGWAMIAPAQTGNAQIDGQANERIASVNHTIETVAYAFLGVDFVLQLAGLTMAVVGAATTRPVRDYAARPARTAWALTGNGVAVKF